MKKRYRKNDPPRILSRFPIHKPPCSASCTCWKSLKFHSDSKFKRGYLAKGSNGDLTHVYLWLLWNITFKTLRLEHMYKLLWIVWIWAGNKWTITKLKKMDEIEPPPTFSRGYKRELWRETRIVQLDGKRRESGAQRQRVELKQKTLHYSMSTFRLSSLPPPVS